MPVLYYHRMLEGFPKALYKSVSYAAGYSKRSFVLTTLDKDDHVLIDPSDGMDLSFPELRLLNEQGLGPKPENIHVVNFDHEVDWKENLYRNHLLMEQLQDNDFDSLYPFTGKSSIVHHLAQELGVAVRTSSVDTAFWAEDKKTLLDFSHLVSVPFGYKVGNNDDLLIRWHDLNHNKNYPGKAVVKASQAASGVTSTIIKTEEHLISFMQEFDLGELDGGVIEEWHDSDPRSPSLNCFIYPDGTYKNLFISDQIFEDTEVVYGQEGTRIYRGNRFPSTFNREIHQKITDSIQPLLEVLHEHGYWGPVGFDTIIVNDTDIFITEINPRITGPHFGWRPMKNLGLSCFSLQNEVVDKNISFGTLRDTLEEVLYSRGTNVGYIILNFFPGKFIGVIVACEPEKLDEIKMRVVDKLQPLRPVA